MSHDEASVLGRVADALYRHGATRVWLFGARASQHAPDWRSDLDLAVEGIGPERLPALARMVGQIAGMKVDLIDLKTAPALIRPHILRTRRLLVR